MSESVEQAALRRASESIDWKGRAEREAAAVLAEAGSHVARSGFYSYAEVLTLCAVAWLQGVNLGSHETLERAEVAFENLRAAL